MKILAELRSLKRQVMDLQENQKEQCVELIGSCSGGPITAIDPIQKISMIEMEVEGLLNQLIDAQAKALKGYENNY